jgi:hypothetical protein
MMSPLSAYPAAYSPQLFVFLFTITEPPIALRFMNCGSLRLRVKFIVTSGITSFFLLQEITPVLMAVNNKKTLIFDKPFTF